MSVDLNREIKTTHMEWTPERIERFWDHEERSPEDYFSYQHGGVIAVRCSRFLRRQKAILDFGCGLGFLIEHLLQQFRGKSKEIRCCVIDRNH